MPKLGYKNTPTTFLCLGEIYKLEVIYYEKSVTAQQGDLRSGKG